jgi:chromate transport protein ChrA
VSLPIPYPAFFQLVIAIDVVIMVGLYMLLRRMSRSSAYYGFVRGMTIFMAIVLVGLVISYVAQATFMGWF